MSTALETPAETPARTWEEGMSAGTWEHVQASGASWEGVHAGGAAAYAAEQACKSEEG
jgi:hypothetical protein